MLDNIYGYCIPCDDPVKPVRIINLDKRNRITHVAFSCGHSNYSLYPKLRYRIWGFIKSKTYYKVKQWFTDRRNRKIVKAYFKEE